MLNVIGHRPLLRPRVLSLLLSPALLTVLSLHKAFRPVNCLRADRLRNDRLRAVRLSIDRLRFDRLRFDHSPVDQLHARQIDTDALQYVLSDLRHRCRLTRYRWRFDRLRILINAIFLHTAHGQPLLTSIDKIPIAWLYQRLIARHRTQLRAA